MGSRKTTIFDRIPLTEEGLKTVPKRQLDDAMVLYDTRQNKHANGAIYLAGFVIECLLKSLLLCESIPGFNKRRRQI